jgi:hypothetical protein
MLSGGEAREIAAGQESGAVPMAQEQADYYQGLSAAYTDAIRASDFKANIVIFFLSIVSGSVIGARDKLPAFLPLPVVLSPFLIVFFCLFVALLPRYPRRGRANFLVSRTATAADFRFVESLDHDVTQLRLRCAILSHILFWKTLCLRASFFICMAGVVVAELLAIVRFR